ncbi:MAG: Z1 domain-containing protein [Pirellulales bacterium]|nr:Z1 domain-containing protein [Pirellulales bacterium]
MPSTPDQVEPWLRIVRTKIDALNVPLNEVLGEVPQALREDVRRRWEEETTQTIRIATVLSGSGGPRPWAASWDASAGYYWRRQRQWLIDHRGWSQAAVGTIDDATDKILAHLEDPRPTGPNEFRVQGLVVGHIQSGKTANFCALVAKAADLGYKLVIVLSGLHNSLRQQTQRRLNRALGIDPAGVAPPEPGRRWITLTQDDPNGDFRPGTVDANVLQGNEHVLLVVKKNSTVLSRLANWMGNHAPPTLPVLIIDDEADQASVNTGGNRPPIDELTDLQPGDIDAANAEDELDPSKINGHIRSLIASFGRVSYVAYTATPFANILINHLGVDREVYLDLYPRDFIISLPRPHGYTGAEVLFGRDAMPGEAEGVEGLDVIELVPDHEADQLTPRRRDLAGFVPRIPPSLDQAMIDFILAVAAQGRRLGVQAPATMLIHTHHRKPVQNELAEAVRQHLATLRQLWRYERDSFSPRLIDRWDRRFRPVSASVRVDDDVPFDEVQPFVDEFLRDPIPVILLNSDSDDRLDFDAEPSLKSVIVGGNTLSRGLTLEGLLVSYYVRKTEQFDTLMQMGRWFGFRDRYVDLTRIWTTEELSGWFHDLSLAEEELRREIARYERERMTPLDFGPKIRAHPVMTITASNKMGSASEITQNYSGRLLQTTFFRLDDRVWLAHNLKTTQHLVGQLGEPNYTAVNDQIPSWRHVPWRVIDAFLAEYQFDARGTNDASAIREYLKRQTEHDELLEWCVSLRALASPGGELGIEPALPIRGQPVARISRTRLRGVPHSIGSLVEPTARGKPIGSGDEEIGLTEQELRDAREEANQTGDFPSALRRRRNPAEGLLLLYPISPFSKPRANSTNRERLFDNPDRDGCTVV